MQLITVRVWECSQYSIRHAKVASMEQPTAPP